MNRTILLLALIVPVMLTGEEIQTDTPNQEAHTHFFPHPGIVGNVGGEWQGTDHLLNLPDGIELYVEVLNTDILPVEINQNKVYETLVKAFKKGNLSPSAEESDPPLPFFHVLIMVTKAGDRYAVYIVGRLFESVTLKRFNLDETTKFQAITWQRQSLSNVSAKELQQEVDKAVTAIGDEFVERFRFYEDLRTRKSRD